MHALHIPYMRDIRPLITMATLLLAGTAHAVDEKWEITTAIEMTGMPMAISMPSPTITVCVPPGQMANEKMIPEKNGCKVTSFKTVGNTSTFNMQCPPPQSISGQGQITRDGPDSYSGLLTASGNINGQALQMKTRYSGRKVGPCDGNESMNAASMLQGQQAPTGAMTAPGAATTPGAMSNTQMMEQMKQMKQLQEMYGR